MRSYVLRFRHLDEDDWQRCGFDKLEHAIGLAKVELFVEREESGIAYEDFIKTIVVTPVYYEDDGTLDRYEVRTTLEQGEARYLIFESNEYELPS